MNLYLLGKQLFTSQPVDFTFEAAGMQIGPLEFTHVPGHTPGQVVLLVHDVLLSADHILERISPHLAPERLTLSTGLDHYLESLEITRSLIDRTKLVLGGHERPFHDLESRIEDTRTLYEQRLVQVLDLAVTPMSIADFSYALFGETAGYHRLLALEEAGAYVEYLSMRGYLGVTTLESLERGDGSPIHYQRVDDEHIEFRRAQSTAVGDPQTGELDVRI
jgi:glyoxylase-like metal-dependent hydrolase (beta-lactamase superfamily II)